MDSRGSEESIDSTFMVFSNAVLFGKFTKVQKTKSLYDHMAFPLMQRNKIPVLIPWFLAPRIIET